MMHDNGVVWLIRMCIRRKSVFYLTARLDEKVLGPSIDLVIYRYHHSHVYTYTNLAHIFDMIL
jgi:hypothetical protein